MTAVPVMTPSTRLDHLDGLRGFAAVLVLYQHLVEYLGAAAPADALARAHLDWTFAWLDFGKLGVVIFFAISGYIVPSSFGGAMPRTGFVVSRFFRLYPAYWVSILAAAWLLPMLGQPGFTATRLLANATMLQSALHQKDVLDVYWTLLIELTFYALCFALFSVDKLRSPRALASLFVALLALAYVGAVRRGGGQGGIPVGVPLYLAVMLFGACMRLATLERNAVARRLCAPMLLALLVLGPLVWSTAYDDHTHKESVMASVSGFCLAVLGFVAVIRWRFFTARAWVYLGAISYSVYLFHPLALEVGRFASSTSAWPLAALIQVGVTLALTAAVAHAVHRGIERPAIRFGKRLVEAVASRPRAAPKLPTP